MQNIDVTQATTAQLRANSTELEKNIYEKQLKKKELVLTQKDIEIYETDRRGEKLVRHWEN